MCPALEDSHIKKESEEAEHSICDCKINVTALHGYLSILPLFLAELKPSNHSVFAGSGVTSAITLQL